MRLSHCAIPLLALCVGLSLAQTSAPTQPDYRQQAADGIGKLQSWYVRDTGLYETTGWWNAANAINMLADYSMAAHSREYVPVLANTFEKAPLKFSGFLNKYYDDEGWWALAWVATYDLTHEPQYLTAADSIFDDMAKGWDDTCGGGIWWSKDKNYKNAIANELFLSVAAHLAARATDHAKRAMYLDWANKEWRWFEHTGMINERHLVNDGLNLKTCQNNKKTTWTYNQGVIVGGLAELNRAKHHRALMTTARAIADATLSQLTDTAGILHDPCEPKCNEDGVQFKGIFVRNLAALNNEAPDARYKHFIEVNVDSIWNKSQGPDHGFGQVWSGPVDTPKAGTQSSALDAFAAAVQMNSAKSK